MTETIQKKGCFLRMVIFYLFFVLLTGCNTHDKITTIGIVSSYFFKETPVWRGFNIGMNDFGYIEGKNIRYIYKQVSEDNEQGIDAAIRDLLNQDLDLMLTMGGRIVDLRAKALVKNSRLPVLFSSEPEPVEIGLVESIKDPGGNMTGVRGADCIPKALEMLKEIIPDLKRVYIPYNPEDVSSIWYLQEVSRAASQIGIELVPHGCHSVEEAIAGIEGLPRDIDAVFMIPSPTFNIRNNELSNAAIKRRVPMGAGLLLDNNVLITYTNDFFNDGKKLARMAKEIFNGERISDLPVETGDIQCIINLQTAEKIGVDVPKGVLAQAQIIIH
jgi:putative tryptophan/tyrosine transport system substrate-binding protein